VHKGHLLTGPTEEEEDLFKTWWSELTLLWYKVKSVEMHRKNGLNNAWQVLASQQVCYNAPMLRNMPIKPVCVYTLNPCLFCRFVLHILQIHRVTPRIKIHHLFPTMDKSIKIVWQLK
jgi:hypothetical protein